MESSNPLLNRSWDRERSGEESRAMTFPGMVNKTGILLLLCFGSAVFSWSQPEFQTLFLFGGMIGALIACLVGTFVPTTTPFTAPAYALLKGLCVGAVSQIFNARYPGIALNALLLTFAVLAVMLTLYTKRIIRVNDRLTQIIIFSTIAIGVLYLVDALLHIFGVRVPFIHDSGIFGVVFSLVVVGVASFNLLLDFDLIEHSIRQRAPAYMEWYCGMALLITLVWLYLEILRLLSKLNRR